MSKEEFADSIGTTVEALEGYNNGDPIPQDILFNISGFTGLPLNEICIDTGKRIDFSAKPIIPEDKFNRIKGLKLGLVEYLKEGEEVFEDKEIVDKISEIENCLNSLTKPKITFAGMSDTGKSTLINALLGDEKMPAKWTPTTSITVCLKHIDDRPAFMKEDVWIFKDDNGKLWDDRKLDDENYCQDLLIAKGDFSLLEKFGTHQSENDDTKQASSAVAFVDNPLLKDCDILDVPGFGVFEKDDQVYEAALAHNTEEKNRSSKAATESSKFVYRISDILKSPLNPSLFKKNEEKKNNEIEKEKYLNTDILIYLSRANGFIQGVEPAKLNETIYMLKAYEKKGENSVKKLGNLFIIASQAGAISGGDNTELTRILDTRSEALCNIIENPDSKELLHERSEQTGYKYSRQDLRNRFFTYEKDLDRLCEGFNKDFTAFLEEFPKAREKELRGVIDLMVADAKGLLKNKVDNWKSAIDNQEYHMELLKKMEDGEPERRTEHTKKINEITAYINELKQDSKSECLTEYTSIMDPNDLLSFLESKGIQNKKSEKEDFVSMVNVRLSDRIKGVITNKSSEYNNKVDEMLDEYARKLNEYSAGLPDINIDFDAKKAFATGLIGVGAVGASAAWLATSLTAWTAFTFGTAFGLAPVLAVGGAVGIAIAGVIAVGKVIFDRFSDKWKRDLVQKIIDEYRKNGYIDSINNDIDKYWDDTENSFKIGMDSINKKWEDTIENERKIAKETDISILQNKLEEAKRGLDFFTQIPIQDIG